MGDTVSGEEVEPADRLSRALAEARQLPDGPGRIAELERIAAHADTIGDVRLGFASRLELIRTHDDGPQRWRVLPPLDWCLAVAARQPERFEPPDLQLLRWYQCGAVAQVSGTFHIGLDWARASLTELERQRPDGEPDEADLARLHCLIADHLGDEPAARRWLARWQADPGTGRGCRACALVRQAELLAGWGDPAAAVRVLEPVLEGVHDCPEQPEQALAAAALPYLRLGRLAEATHAHLHSYQRHRQEYEGFPLLATHLRFCALTGQYERGLDVLAEQLGRLDQPYDDRSAMEFAAAGALVCRLAVAAGLANRGIARPAHADRHGATLLVPSLEADLLATAYHLARRFDARNGTGHQSGRVDAWLAETPGAASLTLPPLAPVVSAGADPVDPSPESEPSDRPGPPLRMVEVAGEVDAYREQPVPLSIEAITAVLDERDDRYVVDTDGSVRGRWNDALIQFERLGERGEILHARVIAVRRLTSDRLAEAYEFCNAWNHDRLLPKAYVHDNGDGQLVIAGEVSTDLEYGVTRSQLAALVTSALATGAALAAAVTDLP